MIGKSTRIFYPSDEAYAASDAKADGRSWLEWIGRTLSCTGIYVRERGYFVVLGMFSQEVSARMLAQESGGIAARSYDYFIVITRSCPAKEADAILEAIEWKNRGYWPQLSESTEDWDTWWSRGCSVPCD